MTSFRMAFPGLIRDNFSFVTPNINLGLGSKYKAETIIDSYLIFSKYLLMAKGEGFGLIQGWTQDAASLESGHTFKSSSVGWVEGYLDHCKYFKMMNKQRIDILISFYFCYQLPILYSPHPNS